MKIYVPQPVIQNRDYAYESLWPVGDADWLELWKFNCTPKSQAWDQRRTVVAPSAVGEPIGDFPYLTSGCLVLSEKAMRVLGELLNGCGELLPVTCIDGRLFTICNPLPCYDCLDQSGSLGQRFEPGGRWMHIERYAFHAKALPNSAIFKISDMKTKVFCSSTFKSAVEDAGLAGLMFREVWNDDGGEVETLGVFDFLKY